MKNVFGIAIVAPLIAVTPACAGQLTFKEETVFYEFSATNLLELEIAIDNATPLKTNGRKYLGRTKRKYTYNYVYDRSGGKCGATDPHLTIRVTYIMPKWTNYREGTKRAQDEWDRFYSALEIHENGHAVTDREKAQKILATIPAVEAQSNCSMLHRLIAKKVSAISSDESEGRKYDADTNHGETQGARLRIPARPSVLARLWSWIFG